MEPGEIKLNECSNCGFCYYELIDGHYYCTECHHQYESVAAIEHDEFTQGDRQKSKFKVKKSSLNQTQEDNLYRRTSYEEYNYILLGLTNEILEIEEIPNFKVTVLQLWISYLKAMDVAFFEDLSHLPKLFHHYREADAQILYNKKPKPKKRRKSKKKVKKKVGDVDTIRKNKRKIRKGLSALDRSESSAASSLSLSTLASMSLDEISLHHEAQELNIEYAGISKEIRRKVLKFNETNGKEVKLDDEGEILVGLRDLFYIRQTALLLNDKTLIFILYCALNICQSKIQLGDLLRFAREGHISFYNFMKHIPEHLTEQLSLSKGHSFSFNKFSTIRMYLPSFVAFIPDLRTSLKVPIMPTLVRRYLKDLNLPDVLGDYIERLINFMPPHNKNDYSKYIPNFEGRAVAYIIFVLKLIFGIDGYREIEISKAAQKLNRKLQEHGIESSVFVYEEWREFIAYRDIILSKYYHSYILSHQYEGDKPYESYLAMLDQVNQEKLAKKKKTHNVHEKKREEKSINAQNLAAKLLATHTRRHEDEEPEMNFSNLFSMTPLYSAMKEIINSNLSSTLNQKIIEKNHRYSSCEFFLKPQNLKNLVPFRLKVKKCTFPRTFCFKRDVPQKRCTVFKLNHEGVKEKIWKNNVKQEAQIKKQKNKEYCMAYHTNKYTLSLSKRKKDRIAVRKKLELRKMKKLQEWDIFDEIFDEKCGDEKDSTDEIADLNELDSILNNSGFEKFKYEKSRRNLTFIVPDFNFWHHHISILDKTSMNLDEVLAKLPRNFRWLLAAASNVVNQDDSDVFRQLSIIENEFIRNVGPIELLDAQPRGIAALW